MAASTVAGGIFNAFAFAGASWIMSHIDKSGYAAEQKRHDLAEEALQREQDKWQRKTRETYERLITSETGDSIYQSVLLCIGLVGASYITDMTMGKKYSTSLKMRDVGALSVSVLVSRFGLDYLYRRRYDN